MAHSLTNRRRFGSSTRPEGSRLLPGRLGLILCWLVAGASLVAAQPPEEASSVADGRSAETLKLLAIQRQAQATLSKVTSSVVSVTGGPESRLSSGSGVVVGEEGYVLTVAHVGEFSGRKVLVTFPDGRTVKGRTLGNDRGLDAGLIKLDGKGPWPHVEMGASKDLKAGQWCLTLGYPVSFERGKPPLARIGRVLRHSPTAIVTDCTIMGGDSGGALFDLEGKVIGVASRCDDSLTMNISVPIDCYHDHWDRLVKGDNFNSRSTTVANLALEPDEDTDEARVGRVVPGTTADEAGILAGDLILKVDGKEIHEFADLFSRIKEREPGDEVQLEILREGETLKLRAILGRKKK